MKNIANKSTIPSCGCNRCQCQRELRCLCHDYNALLALAVSDLNRKLRNRKTR